MLSSSHRIHFTSSSSSLGGILTLTTRSALSSNNCLAITGSCLVNSLASKKPELSLSYFSKTACSGADPCLAEAFERDQRKN